MSVTNEHTMAVQKSHACQHPLATLLRSLSGALEYLLKFIVEFNHTSVGDLQFQFELTVFHGPPYDSREKGRDAVDPEAPQRETFSLRSLPYAPFISQLSERSL
jgi:hypothetical protein